MTNTNPNDRGPPEDPASHRQAAKADQASGRAGGDFARWRNGQASELEDDFKNWRQIERRRHAEAFEDWRHQRNAARETEGHGKTEQGKEK